MKSKRVAAVSIANCVACGECAKICPIGAAKIIKGCYAKINEDVCVGCGKCAQNCPSNAITLADRQTANSENKAAALTDRRATNSAGKQSAALADNQAARNL